MERGNHTQEEIFSQTTAWAGALREVERNKQALLDLDFKTYNQVIFSGCGSTYYLSLAAAPLFQSLTGVICKAVPGGELFMNPATVYSKGKDLLVAISRSGSTSETVKAAQQFINDGKGPVISISNYDGQPLTELSDLVFAIKEGQEKSVAQTRSFSSMLVTANAMAMLVSGNEDIFEGMYRLPELGERLMRDYHDLAKRTGENLNYDRFYFLGSGLRYGLACEANLKMKEMTLTHTEPFHFLEFRHGPKSMVDENTVVVGLLSEGQREYEEKVLVEMKEMGATVLSLAEKDAVISFESKLPECANAILYMPLLQVMAYYRAIAKELDPDNPKNLTSVIYLD